MKVDITYPGKEEESAAAPSVSSCFEPGESLESLRRLLPPDFRLLLSLALPFTVELMVEFLVDFLDDDDELVFFDDLRGEIKKVKEQYFRKRDFSYFKFKTRIFTTG